MRQVVLLLPILSVSIACKMGPPAEAKADPEGTPPKPDVRLEAKAESAAPLKLGEAVTVPVVALSDIAKQPGSFKGKTIATTGKVAAVCQEKGCWMEIVDTENHANVRMHGHSFFVPRSSSGKSAKVQGTVVLTKDGHECEEMESTGAKLELDATGVELL